MVYLWGLAAKQNSLPVSRIQGAERTYSEAHVTPGIEHWILGTEDHSCHNFLKPQNVFSLFDADETKSERVVKSHL